MSTSAKASAIWPELHARSLDETDKVADNAEPESAVVSTPSAILPPEVTARLLADTEAIARRMTRRLADEIPLTPEFRSVGYLRVVMTSCRDALRIFIRLLHDGHGPRGGELARLGLAGSRQAELGVPLEVLLSAYRLAAKIVWEEVVADAMASTELSPATVIQVTAQVLEYLDGISGAVGAAYLETRERLMRQHDRERDRILQRLLAGDASEEMRRLAAWHDLDLHPPYRILALALPETAEEPERQLGAAWIGAGAILVPDEPGRWVVLLPISAPADSLAAATVGAAGADTGVRVGMGPAVASLAEIAEATRRARQALSVGCRLAPSRRIHHHGELGVFATLASDPEELRAYVEHLLGPLLRDAHRRGDLLTTLETLLSTASLTEAARRLGLHRHTLVYRADRLREILGIDIDDAAVRHTLWLALQALHLLEPEEFQG